MELSRENILKMESGEELDRLVVDIVFDCGYAGRKYSTNWIIVLISLTSIIGHSY